MSEVPLPDLGGAEAGVKGSMAFLQNNFRCPPMLGAKSIQSTCGRSKGCNPQHAMRGLTTKKSIAEEAVDPSTKQRQEEVEYPAGKWHFRGYLRGIEPGIDPVA